MTIAMLLFPPAASARSPAGGLMAPAPRSSAVGPAVRPSLPPGSRPAWFDLVTKEIESSEYRFSLRPDGKWSAPNRRNDLRTTVLARGVTLGPRSRGEGAWRLGMGLESWGRDRRRFPAGTPQRRLSPSRIEFQFETAGLTEWYVNDETGLEQGFTVNRAPERADPADHLVLEIALSGGLRGEIEPGDRSVLWREAAGVPVLRYGGLAVRDAGGRELPAWLRLGQDRLEIWIDDRQADYPLAVDPLMTSPVWTGSGGQPDELYGYSVSGAGDVNGDGFDDIIVGAYGYDGGFFGQGRAYLYLGSSNGPGTSPAWIGTHPQMSANYGYSVSTAGDVNNDGYDDVIIGAFYYSNNPDYEGGAFVYLGSPSGLQSSPSSIVESGDGFSQFGSTVGAAGDVNGDGYGDVIVGAPYFTIQNQRVGAAWVYSGSASGQLSNGRRLDHNLQKTYGYSVSGAGDVDNDGYDDVIVGALNSGAQGEGYALVYLGAANGVSRTAAWTHSEGNRSGFGGAVSGAGDVNNDGFDDIIVGDGSVLGGAFVYHGSPTGPGPLAWSAGGAGVINHCVSSAGDVNGDGYGDVIVGELSYDRGETDEGRILVYLGSLTGLAPAAAWTAESNIPGVLMGATVASAGDVNGDGLDDVIAGGPGPTGGPGTAMVFLGGSTTELIDPACGTDTDCNGEHLERLFGEVRLKPADDLVDARVVRTGITTDGVTLLLLRKATDAPITFSLKATDGSPLGPEWGVLMRTDGSLEGSSVTVPYESTARGTFAFALYRPPSTFPGGEAAVEPGQPLTIEAAGSGRIENISLRLFPPPVILIHGVWSSFKAWTAPGGGLESFLTTRGYDVCPLCRVDYGTWQPAPEFDPRATNPADRYAIGTMIQAAANARFHRRLRGIATTQADVVAHSLGGLLTRARVAFPREPYATKANFLQGEFHKLITIGTPHSGSPLATWLVEHKCDPLQIGSQPFSIDTYFSLFGKPIGPAVYGLQPSSAALQHLGPTDLPAFTLQAIEPAFSLTETELNLIPRLTGHLLTTIDSLLGGEGNHDTIVPLSSQQGGIGRTIVRNDIVHADMSVDGLDTGETESSQLWSDVLNLLQASLDVFATSLPAPPLPATAPIQPVTCTLSAPPPSPSTASVTLTPPPSTPVQPGQDVLITLNVDGGNPVDGVLFLVDHRLLSIAGPGPFSFTYHVPEDRAGIIDIRADTFGPGPENYSATSSLIIGRPTSPVSIGAAPAAITISQIGEAFQVRVTGQYADGTAIDLSSPGAGTTYTVQSGNNQVIAVSSAGLVEARGAGLDVVVVRNSGLSATVLVTVAITNQPPAIAPIAPVTMLAGESLDLPIAASDPDGDPLAIGGIGLPPFATVVDLGGGAGRLALRPVAGDEGTYSLLVTATDEGAPPLGAGATVMVMVNTCPRPAGSPILSAAQDLLSWTALPDATSYDVVRGSLLSLRDTGGDFTAATDQCLAQGTPDLSIADASTPATGQGFWFLVRGTGCGGHGTYDSGGPGQDHSRDSGINASPVSCP